MKSLDPIRCRSVVPSVVTGSSLDAGGGWYRLLRALPILLALLLAGGCATSTGSSPPRLGSGLAEYRQMVLDVRKATTAARQFTESLAAASEASGGTALARFDESVHRLEIVSMKARSRADAMEKRGGAYFEEWDADIAATGDAAARAKAGERRAELHRHYDGLLQGSKQVRQEIRQFLEGLRQLRTSLGRETLGTALGTALGKARPALAATAASGRKAEEAMDALVGRLNSAESILKSGTAATSQH